MLKFYDGDKVISYYTDCQKIRQWHADHGNSLVEHPEDFLVSIGGKQVRLTLVMS